MPVYQYRGYKADGAAATGIVDAESPKVARLKLRKDGVFPTEMAEQEGATRGMSSRSEPASGPSLGHRSQILTVTDVALMTRQMATLLVAGLPLVDALGVLMDQTEKKAIKGLIADVREAIRGGASYSAVLERYPRDFSPSMSTWCAPGKPAAPSIRSCFAWLSFWKNNWPSNTK